MSVAKNYNQNHKHESWIPLHKEDCVICDDENNDVINLPLNYVRQVTGNSRHIYITKTTVGVWKIKGKKYV